MQGGSSALLGCIPPDARWVLACLFFFSLFCPVGYEVELFGVNAFG